MWCSAAALETVHHTRGRRQQATAPAQSQRRGTPKHRSGTPTGILSTWHDANTEGGTTPFLTLSRTVWCWVCVARLALKRISAVWLGGCSGSAASMAAATKALRPGRDAHSGTDGPSSFCKRSQRWRSVQGRGTHLEDRLGSSGAAFATAGAWGLDLGWDGGVWRRWLVRARFSGGCAVRWRLG